MWKCGGSPSATRVPENPESKLRDQTMTSKTKKSPLHRTPPKRVGARIPLILQKTPFSCGASCLQMMVAVDGIHLSHLKAIRLLNAFPDGTDMSVFRRVYSKLTGRTLHRITIAKIKAALNRGVPVLATDSVTTKYDHVIVVADWDGDDFIVRDPALFSLKKGFHRSRRSREALREAAGNQFYAPGEREPGAKQLRSKICIPC